MKYNTIYALGFFDGVHVGHSALLSACRNLAEQTGCQAGAVTFESHPDALVLGAAPGLINTKADRERLLRERGMDTVVFLPFDKQMMTMPWQDFFHLLLTKYHAAGLVCGEDFRFGDRGAGSSALLLEACREAGIPCVVVPEQKIDGFPVSSTRIRALLEAGEPEKAAELLGHPHILTGQVIPGRQLGRTIGIPTANLALPDGLLVPRHGVYACLAKTGRAQYAAVTNIGIRPTVGGSSVTVEPWLLDFTGDLYGSELTLEFYKFLRPEQKFPSLEDLQREIQKNAEETREFFGKK